MTRTPAKGLHYESEVEFIRSEPTGELQVVKRYRTDHPCVAWLNEALAEWYDPARGLPVAQHEHAALELLSPHGAAPPSLELRADAIVSAFAGEPVSRRSRITADDYLEQCERILDVFAEVGLRHNDLLPRNVLVQDRRVSVVDYTLAEFGAVSLMDRLPDPAWARPGEDRELLLGAASELRGPRIASLLARWG